MSLETKTLCILIAEDDELLREALSVDLRKFNWEVVHAENGKAAFEIIKKRKVDVVLSDVRMPGGSGIDLLESISKMDVNKPIAIMMSGFSDLNEAKAKEKGAYAFLPKPFRASQLLELVRKAKN